MLIIVFGLAGVGKTFVGQVLKDKFGFTFYDGDKNLTSDMQQAIRDKKLFTDDMRDVFFNKLIESVELLSKKHKRLVVSQTFIKEKYRIKFLKAFPNAQFILVQTKKLLRDKRLKKRNDIDLNYVFRMDKIFEKPKIDHFVLENNMDGKEDLEKEIYNLRSNFSL